jgi:plastocyanin
MAQTWMVSIDEQPDQTQAQFNPQSLTIANGDCVFWRNNTSQPHQPKPVNGDADAWMEEIPGKLPDQPAPTSRQVTFAADTGPDGKPIATPPFDYVCACDETMTGSITIKLS